MNFEEKVQQWVQNDNQIKQLQEKIKLLRDNKHKLTESLHNYAEQNKLSGATIQITDGKLKFAEMRVSQPLTFTYVEACLKDIISKDEQVKQIMQHIRSKREVKVVQEIKRIPLSSS